MIFSAFLHSFSFSSIFHHRFYFNILQRKSPASAGPFSTGWAGRPQPADEHADRPRKPETPPEKSGEDFTARRIPFLVFRPCCDRRGRIGCFAAGWPSFSPFPSHIHPHQIIHRFVVLLRIFHKNFPHRWKTRAERIFDLPQSLIEFFEIFLCHEPYPFLKTISFSYYTTGFDTIWCKKPISGNSWNQFPAVPLLHFRFLLCILIGRRPNSRTDNRSPRSRRTGFSKNRRFAGKGSGSSAERMKTDFSGTRLKRSYR